MYDDSSGLWSIDTLSVARGAFAATTVDGLALFGGGYTASWTGAYSNVVDIYTLPPPPPGAVPEPPTVSLLLLGALTLLVRGRRARQE